MRKALLAVAALFTTAIPAAPAQEVTAVVGFDQGACASFSERLSSGTLSADVCGIDYAEVVSDAGLDAGTAACASVDYQPDNESAQNPAFVDIGCGPLMLEVDPLLQRAHIEGSLPSRVYNATTGGFLNDSTIAVDVDWTGKGDPDAGVGESANVFTTPFIDAHGSVVIVKAADAVGPITSGVMDGPNGTARDAVIDEGIDLYVTAVP